MEKEQQPIIIKKIKKNKHGGHHGGAWKVAYADFVTAMMAFFLVMWLIAILSIETKKAVAEYMRSFTIFSGEKAGGSGSAGVMVIGGDILKLSEELGSTKRGEHVEKGIVFNITRIIEENIRQEYKDQVLVAATNYGARIEMVEKTGSPMFETGKAVITPAGKEIIRVVSEGIKGTTNDIIIEGHTDAHQYQKEDYTNWELASDRANTLRRELIDDGIDAVRIKQVASFADRLPIKTEDPYAPVNRRVSILLLDKKKENVIKENLPNKEDVSDGLKRDDK